MASSEPDMPGADRDEESGQYTATYPDEDFLDAIRERELPTTPELAEAVGCDRRTAHVRLTELEDSGIVKSKRVGGSLVWMSDRQIRCLNCDHVFELEDAIESDGLRYCPVCESSDLEE